VWLVLDDDWTTVESTHYNCETSRQRSTEQSFDDVDVVK